MVDGSFSMIGLITLTVNETGKPSAGNLHAGFDAAGTGNQFTIELPRNSRAEPVRYAALGSMGTSS